jgi:hypothetical protein
MAVAVRPALGTAPERADQRPSETWPRLRRSRRGETRFGELRGSASA